MWIAKAKKTIMIIQTNPITDIEFQDKWYMTWTSDTQVWAYNNTLSQWISFHTRTNADNVIFIPEASPLPFSPDQVYGKTHCYQFTQKYRTGCYKHFKHPLGMILKLEHE